MTLPQSPVPGRDDRPITTDDLKDLQYLDRCIKEALRLFPSVPMFARVIEEECQIGTRKLTGHLDIM